MIISDADLRLRLMEIKQRSWIEIPDGEGYGGTGAPGRLLETLLGLQGGNSDTPDAGKWEIKFHSRRSLLTLFHLEGQPSRHMHQMVRKFGWPDGKGRVSFRHTIHGRSSKGFYVTNADGCIAVRHDAAGKNDCPYWTHDALVNAFASKFRRLVVVKGTKRKNYVRYDTAHLYWEPKTTMFIQAIENGVVAIDFDARTNLVGEGLRNHGTKFRIKYEDLCPLYSHQQEVK